MGEVEWSASSSETNPMLGIGRQSKRQSIGIMWGLSRPILAGGGWGPWWWWWWQLLGWHRRTLMQVDLPLPLPQQTLHMVSDKERGEKSGGGRENGHLAPSI